MTAKKQAGQEAVVVEEVAAVEVQEPAIVVKEEESAQSVAAAPKNEAAGVLVADANDSVFRSADKEAGGFSEAEVSRISRE